MIEPVIVVCMRKAPGFIPAAGSSTAECVECHREVWRSPASIADTKQFPIITVKCVPCATPQMLNDPEIEIQPISEGQKRELRHRPEDN